MQSAPFVLIIDADLYPAVGAILVIARIRSPGSGEYKCWANMKLAPTICVFKHMGNKYLLNLTKQ